MTCLRYLFLLSSVLLVGSFFAIGSAAPVWVACVGNSITYGVGVNDRESNSYPSKLQELLGEGYLVGNFGKSGATLLKKGHRPYMEQMEFHQALDFRPDIVVIHLGVNDTDPRDFPEYGDDFIRDYSALIDSFKTVNPNVRIILANLSPILASHPRFKSGTRAWRDSIRTLIPVVALHTGSELIDFGEVLQDYPNLIEDGVHPNNVGASIISEAVEKAITGESGPLSLPSIYGDGMILQRYKPLKISGKANAGKKVMVTVADIKAYAVADNRGRWTVTLPPLKESESETMIVTDGLDSLVFNNVAVGEVWIASGQSNMAFRLNEAISFEEDIKDANDPFLRFYNLESTVRNTPSALTEEEKYLIDSMKYYAPTTWKGSNAENAPRWSAVAWHFGKMLRERLGVPVGIISNAIGGATAESWVDIETLEQNIPEILVDWKTNDYTQVWVKERVDMNVGAKSPNRHPYEPSYLFATGIRPLESYPVAGVIWYQGESNAHNAEAHETIFRSLVESWRKNWDNPRLPFIFVQLSSIDRPSWPVFRDSQRRLALELEDVAMVVSSDYGDSLDVHPRDKKPIGERLGRQALRRVYSCGNIISEGPRPLKAVRGSGECEVIVTFDSDGGVGKDSLSTSDGTGVKTFEVASDKGGIFYPADSVDIIGNTLKIYCMKVKNPGFVRYGWQPFTRANLVNGSGLPASTFKIKVDSADSAENGFDCGLSGMFAGTVNGSVIQAGGCNFPENPMAPASKKKFYKGIYILNESSDGAGWSPEKIGELPRGVAYGSSASVPQGFVMMGGVAEDGTSLTDVMLLKIDDVGNVHLKALPSLPVATDNAVAAYFDGKVYLAGGNAGGVPSTQLLCLDMNDFAKGWVYLKPMPGNPRTQPVMAAIDNSLYLWGGFAGRTSDREPSLNTDGVKYDIKRNKWSMLPSPSDPDGEDISTGGGAAVSLPDGRIAVIGGVNKDIFIEALRNQAPDYLSHPAEWYRFNPYVLVFNPEDDTWTVALRTSDASRAGASAVATDSGDVIVLGGEIKPRIRTADVLKLHIE